MNRTSFSHLIILVTCYFSLFSKLPFQTEFTYLAFVTALLLSAKKEIKRHLLYIYLTINTINIVSNTSFALFAGSQFNFRSIVHLSILTLPILFPFNFEKKSFSQINKAFIILLVITTTVSLVSSFKSYGISWLLNGDFSKSYSFLYYDQFSISKQILPFYLITLSILTWSHLKKNSKIILAITIISTVILFASRTNLIGIFCLLGIIFISRLKHLKVKLTIYFALAASLLYSIFSNLEIINTAACLNGRFIIPVISSPSFFYFPWGFGWGNYANTVYEGIWNGVHIPALAALAVKNILGQYQSIYNLPILPMAESDILLLGVSFGVIGIIIYSSFTIKSIIIINTKRVFNSKYINIIIFIFFSGIFQDYMSLPLTWYFLITAYKNFNT